MLKQVMVVTVGIGAGILILKAISKESKSKSKNVEMELEDFIGLLKEHLVVENLSGDELSKWFRENEILAAEDINKIIAYPTKEVLNGLGYQFNDELDTNKSIIQVFYNTKNEKILKLRFISFAEIDSKLKSMLEKDGMIVIE
ncbi:hypothetical protein KPL47_18835 [Clostridium estertheticum]|uniref:hypothetical protein n=1 Tax=Clostridium estertheticum TaxID=238834 RepID=UPI001C0C9515|nr:hypothetical protein [Clostridium estertheticum]MBU3178384.1 hypothetical protein [Clostridium estertheticum]